MEKERIRSLDQMPSAIKQAYSSILVGMVKAGDGGNQLKLAELYRLFANIKLGAQERMALYPLIKEADMDLPQLIQTMLHGVSPQERNILRFSLIKDLIIIMDADYSSDADENLLLMKLVKLLDITDEQLQYFMDEHQQDLLFRQKVEGDFYQEMVQEAAAKALALGIPLGMVHFSRYQALSWSSPLRSMKEIRKSKSQKALERLGFMALVLAVSYGTYHTAKWFLSKGNRDEKKYRAHLQEAMEELHERAIAYLEQDMTQMRRFIRETKSSREKEEHLEVYKLLDKTLATLKATEPKLI